MVSTNIIDQRKKEGRGWLLITLSLIYLFFSLFLWVFMLGSQSSFSFTFGISFKSISEFYTFLINALIMYLPLFTTIAILSKKKIGMYALILSFLAFVQTEIWSWESAFQFQNVIQVFVTSYLTPLIFWILYFYAIKRKWSLFQ